MLFVLFSFLAVFVYGKQLLTGDYFRGGGNSQLDKVNISTACE